MAQIGFIGLGIMGRPMAEKLLENGCSLLVNDLNPKAQEALVKCGAQAACLTEIGTQCDVVFTMLPNGAIVSSTLFGTGGVGETLSAGALVVDFSSVTPEESQECWSRLHKRGIGFVDAPVSGGEPKAIDGTLAIMAGGTLEDFQRAEPYLHMVGSSAIRIGGPGSGSVAKLANQIIVNLTIAAVSEAMVLSAKAGADPGKVFEAIRSGLAGSTVLEAKVPMMLARNFEPGGKISINHKDIKNVLSAAHSLDVPLPLTAQLFEIMQSLKVSGHFQDDHAGIVQFYEGLAGIQVHSMS